MALLHTGPYAIYSVIYNTVFKSLLCTAPLYTVYFILLYTAVFNTMHRAMCSTIHSTIFYYIQYTVLCCTLHNVLNPCYCYVLQYYVLIGGTPLPYWPLQLQTSSWKRFGLSCYTQAGMVAPVMRGYYTIYTILYY